MAIKIKAISHQGINVRDMDKAKAFYCGILGFPVAFSISRNEKPWIEYLKVAPRMFIELFYADPGQDFPGDNPSYDHLCLQIEDIFACEKAIDEAGWPVMIRPKQGGDTNWQMWVKDPDGNKLELMQISSDSPQAKACRA